METKQYTEYEKQTDGKWIKQHPETEAGNIKGLNRSITFGVVEDIIKNPNSGHGMEYHYHQRWLYR